jgi:predicted secreted protein with PEFG-CTERM motif
MDYKAYTLIAILLTSLALVVPIGTTYATTNTTGAATTDEANAPAINSTGGQSKTFDLTVGGQTRPIQYMITGGSVENMTVYSENQTLGVTINSTGNGTLSVTLPRDVLDSKTPQGSDADFAAFIDNAEYADPGEIAPAADARTLLIGFPAGVESIDIIGTTTNAGTAGGNATTAGTAGGNATTAGTAGGNATTAGTAGGNATIPEFSTISVVVLAVAIIGIIIATARYGKFSLGQRT